MARPYQDRAWGWISRTKGNMNSIQVRLVSLAALIFVATWIGAAVISNTQGFRNTQAILEREVAMMAGALAATKGEGFGPVEEMIDPALHSVHVWQGDRLVLSSGPVGRDGFANANAFSTQIDGETWVFAENCMDGTCVRYGATHQRRHQNLYCLAASIFGPLFFILAGGFGLMVLAIRHALKPLNEVAARVASLDLERPRRLQTVGQQKEFSPLIEAVNLLGSRVRSLLDRERVFLGTCAHEIRTPLAGLLGQLQLVGEDAKLESARHCAERTARVADQFLTFAASKNLNVAEDTAEVFDFCEVVRDAIAPLIQDTDTDVEMTGLARLDVHGHAFALGSVASNLVQNALKYGCNLQGRSKVWIDVTMTEGRLFFTVEDNGEGLSEEGIATALREFSRVDARSSHTGAGLGLSIVQEIAAQYGGSAQVSRSMLLGGLKVMVSLPIVVDESRDQTTDVLSHITPIGSYRVPLEVQAV